MRTVCSSSARIAQEEIFEPVMQIMKFVDELLEHANKTIYGLAEYIC